MSLISKGSDIMNQVEVTITMKGQDKSKETFQGEYNEIEERLIIHDSKNKIMMEMDFKKQRLTRETEEFLLTIPFSKGKETTLTIKLLDSKQTLELNVLTEIYEYKERKLKVKYKMIESNEWIEYQIEF